MSSTPSLTGALWSPKHAPKEVVQSLEDQGLGPIAARCAAIRWADLDVPAPKDFVPTWEHLLDPFEMHGMAEAVERLHRATRDSERIRIITDYDVDGTTSSLILQAALRVVQPDVALDYHIPNRLTEGYGLSVESVDDAADAGVNLIIAADIGVRDHAAVTRARERGVDVLICDHHLPEGSDVPAEALVLCPPQQRCSYPNKFLAACGISLKVAQALLTDHPRRDSIVRSLLKLAAIGTIADLVPLTARENRAIVSLGLAELNGGRHAAGLQALLDICGLQKGAISEWDLGFRIGPRINAAGRIADAATVIRLLTCREPAMARSLANELEGYNLRRRHIQERLALEALERVEDCPDAFLVVAGAEADGWHRGVIGIVASRLREQLHRPVAVVSQGEEFAVGSIRSVPGVHAVKALDAASHLLVKYGGHPVAAGFTVPSGRLGELRVELNRYVEQQVRPEDLVPIEHVDAEVDATQLDWPLYEELARLGPFGAGNPMPRLVIGRVYPRNVRLLGAAKRMVKFTVPRDGAAAIEAIWWDHPEHADALSSQPVDLIATLDINRWRGDSRLQLRIRDARPSQ